MLAHPRARTKKTFLMHAPPRARAKETFLVLAHPRSCTKKTFGALYHPRASFPGYGLIPASNTASWWRLSLQFAAKLARFSF